MKFKANLGFIIWPVKEGIMAEISEEEKRKIYGEEKARVEAQEKLKKEAAAKKNKNAAIGCLGLIIVIAIVIISGILRDKGAKPAAKKELMPAAAWAKVESAVNTALKEGLVQKLDVQAGKAWIKEMVWELSNAEVKENTATILATYCAVKKNMEYRSIEIIGWQSGRKLASYNSWSGFKVY